MRNGGGDAWSSRDLSQSYRLCNVLIEENRVQRPIVNELAAWRKNVPKASHAAIIDK